MRPLGTLSGEPSRLSGWLSFLLSGRGAFVFWIVFGIVHAVLRLSISRTLSLDDARASELVQDFALGYQERQPPLYEWILWSVQQLVGPEIESHLIVRYSLIAGIGMACYGAARAALKNDRWAAAASISLAASYPVGWSFHEWGTQTMLLCIACFATLHAAINWLEKPSVRVAIWLGVAIGVGLLSKFSYPLFLGGLSIACLSMKETRHGLADRRLILSAVIALLICAPYLYWLVQVHADVLQAVEHTMVTYEKPYLTRVVMGLARLAKSILLFPLPWLAFVAVVAPRAFGFGDVSAPPAGIVERLTLRTMVIAAILVTAGILAIGATNIAERYMHPVAIVAPVYVFARVSRFDAGETSIRPLMILSLGAAIAVIGIRIAAVTDNIFAKRADRLFQVPYRMLASELEKRGVEYGTIITTDVRDAGNLRAFLPNLRVIGRDSFRALNPSRRTKDDGSCRLLYRDTRTNEEQLASLPSLTAERIVISPPPSLFGAPRHGVWFLAKLDPNAAVCR